ncbi:HAMP domain-containing protein, partial [Acidisoma sp. C75]
MPITGKILLILGIFGVFVLGVAFYATGQLKTTDRNYSALISNQQKAALALARAARNLQSVRGAAGDIAVATSSDQSDAAYAEFKTSFAQFNQLMDEAMAGDRGSAAALAALKAQAGDVVLKKCQQAITDARKAILPTQLLIAQSEYVSGCAPGFHSITGALIEEVKALAAQARTASHALSGTTARSVVYTFAGIIVGLIVIFIIGFIGARAWIVRPVRAQIGFMDRLSEGQFDIEIAGVERKDEVGAIARAVEGFRDAGREKLRVEAAAGEHRAEAEAARVAQEAERAEVAARTTAVVEQVALGLEKLAEGDLLFRLNRAFSAEYEKLR